MEVRFWPRVEPVAATTVHGLVTPLLTVVSGGFAASETG
jgi:hypothetical protein